MFHLVFGSLVIGWIGAAALAYRKYGARGLLGIPLGLFILLGLWLGTVLLLIGPRGGL